MAQLTAAVGKGGRNLKADVSQVQAHINAQAREIGLPAPLKVDGIVGGQTLKAIELFQRKAVGLQNPDSRVDPGGKTWQNLTKLFVPSRVDPEQPVSVAGKPSHPVDPSSATINAEGADIIKSSEGLRLVAYEDAVKVLTIGWGHTGPDVTKGKVITQTEAQSLFEKDVAKFEKAIRDNVKVPLSANQFSALVSFTYNVGPENFKSSTLLKLLNQGDYQGAANQFSRWNKAGGQVLNGLITRRAAEQKLFQTNNSPAKSDRDVL